MAHLNCHMLFFLSSLALFLTTSTEADRPPHGVAYEHPTAFSPSAYEFFHPKTEASGKNRANPPLPVAAKVEAAEGGEARAGDNGSYESGKRNLGSGAIVGIVLGLAFTVFLAMGSYYVTVKRRANITQANAVKPDA